MPPRQREIDAFHVAPPHLVLKCGVGLVAACHDQQAAGPSVEAVDDARSLGIGPSGEQLSQLVDQGRPAV